MLVGELTLAHTGTVGCQCIKIGGVQIPKGKTVAEKAGSSNDTEMGVNEAFGNINFMTSIERNFTHSTDTKIYCSCCTDTTVSVVADCRLDSCCLLLMFLVLWCFDIISLEMHSASLRTIKIFRLRMIE